MFTKKTRVISAIATVCMLISMLACIAVPAYAEDLSSYPSVTTVTSAGDRTGTDYTVANATEWMHLYNNAAHFQSTDVTIHIIGEIDMTGQTGFASIYNPAFSLDGHGNTIKNWGTAAAPQKTMGMFRFSTGAGMNFIKNLTLDNCHTTGSGGSDSTMLVTLAGADNNGRNSMSANFVMENVHIKNSSLTAEGARSGFFIANYVKADGDYSVTLKNCSLTGSTLHGTTNGHSGLLIGKASSFNGKKATYNLTNVYVAGNTMNAKRGDNYVGLGIGNVEINTTAIAQMAVNINNVVFEGNTYNHVGAQIGLFGNMVCTALNVKGLVFEDNTTTTTATETGRYIFKSAAASAAFDMSGVYCNDTAVTAGSLGNTAAGVKLADSYMTSGEAAAAANTAASADSLYWYTTNAEGVALGTAANATRKVELELGSEIVKTYYANCDATVTVDYNEVDPTSTFALKDAASGTLTDGNKVAFAGNNNIVVVVTLGEVAALAAAKEALTETIGYFDARNMGYYVAAAATELAEAKAVLADDAATKQDYIDAEAALAAFKTQYAITKDNAPSMTEIAKYPGAPVYVIRTAADFQAMEDNKSLFDADDTVYMVNDVDMKGSTFNGIEAFKASFDGQGYKIKNWGIAADGETKAAITTRGLFYNTSGGAAAIKSLKNVTLVNCHTIANETYSAMFYGVGHGNAGMAADGAATTLTIENIHFEGCSITVTGTTKKEVVAFLLGRYTIAGKDAAINITNCSVTGSTFDASAATTDSGHFGLLIGKPRGGNSNEKAHYTLTDCYLANNTIKYSRTDGGYIGVVFGTAEAQTGTKVIMNNVGVVGNNVTVGGTHVSLVGHVQTSAIDVNGLLVKGNTVTGGSAVLFRDGGNVTMKNAYCSDTIANVTTATSSAALAGTNTDAAAAYAVNAVSGGDLWWTTAEGAAVKGTDANATRKVELKLGTGEVVGTYYANVGETVTVAYAEEPMAEFSIDGESGTIADGNKVTVNKNADVVVAVSLGAAQELANAKAALQEAIDYYTVDRKIEYFKAEVATAITEAEPLLESSDTAAILAKVAALNALQGEVVDAYPNVPSISEMSKYPAMKNYKIMTKEDLAAAAANTDLKAAGITLHLGADIDLTGYTFNGFNQGSFNFDGHEKTISNWTAANDAAWGLFGNHYMGTIKNVTLDNCHVSNAYGRALLIGTYNGIGYAAKGNITVENVHILNSSVTATTNGKNLGGIIMGQMNAAYTLTVKNCSVIDTEIKADGTTNTGITNSGIICGRASHNASYIVENIYVDGFMNNANPATVSKGNGILFGTVESGLAEISVDGAIIVNCGGTAAYELAGWQYNDKAISYKNIFAAGNDTLALNGGNSVYTNTTVENIFTDSNNLFATFNSGSDSAHNSVTTEMEGITVMDAAAFKSGEAAYKLNKAAGKALALVDDSFNAYPVMFATEGYAAPFAVTFVDQSDNNKVVATLYTNASGKLNETAVTALLENDAYGWKNGEADVTAADVYTADTTLTSNVSHDWENGTYDQLDNNQHKLTCGDDGCTVYKIEDCAHAKYVHRVDGDKHVHDSVCACGRVLATEECTLSKTTAGDEQHTVACDTCDYEETVACVFENFRHDEETVGAASTHTGTCACGNDKTTACTFGDWVETTPADYGVCGVETKTCSVAGCGYSYTRTLAMETNTEVIIETESVDLGVNPAVDIYLDIDGLGLAGAKVTILTELEIGAGELGEAFPFAEFEEIEGGIEMIVASDENLTGRVLLASFGLVAPAAAGNYDIEVIVEEAIVLSGEGEGAIELPAEVAGATAEVVVREAIPGDVNGDGDVTMADAVLVLRVVNGTLNAEEISAVGADVDGVAGITTADAVAILKMVMGKY